MFRQLTFLQRPTPFNFQDAFLAVYRKLTRLHSEILNSEVECLVEVETKEYLEMLLHTTFQCPVVFHLPCLLSVLDEESAFQRIAKDILEHLSQLCTCFSAVISDCSKLKRSRKTLSFVLSKTVILPLSLQSRMDRLGISPARCYVRGQNKKLIENLWYRLNVLAIRLLRIFENFERPIEEFLRSHPHLEESSSSEAESVSTSDTR